MRAYEAPANSATLLSYPKHGQARYKTRLHVFPTSQNPIILYFRTTIQGIRLLQHLRQLPCRMKKVNLHLLPRIIGIQKG
jgi:hypothetical protein